MLIYYMKTYELGYFRPEVSVSYFGGFMEGEVKETELLMCLLLADIRIYTHKFTF